MVHELDLKTAKARCIDLPGTGDYGSATSWALVLSNDGADALGGQPGLRPRRGDRRRDAEGDRHVPDRAAAAGSSDGGTNAALSPDGQQIAIADRETVAVVGLSERRVLQRDPAHALALGYSPDGANLWKLS